MRSLILLAVCVLATGTVRGAAGSGPSETTLPPGVKAVWDLGKAFRETTPTRERICINGLWQWQPAEKKAEQVPADNWGYFKVPGCWPGITDYMQEDCQTVYSASRAGKARSWPASRRPGISARSASRRSGPAVASYSVQYLNSYAVVYVDGKKVGEIHFPAGELDLTPACPAGSKHVLSMLVVAMPLSAVLLSFTTPTRPKSAGPLHGAGCAATFTWRASPLPRTHRRREGRHVGAQGGDHLQRRARGPGGGRPLHPARRH